MPMRLWKKKLPDRQDKPFKERNKITGKALDNKTIDVIIWMINNGKIASLDYPVSSGKEAVVFRATTPKREFVAVKVFKYETTAFRHMNRYIEGDPRFENIDRRPRSMVKEWASKEFANLNLASQAGVAVPKPILLRENTIIMEFLGWEGVPFALLQDVVLSDPKKTFRKIVSSMKKLYKAGLVHADLSPYNIIISLDKDSKETPCIIDWAQGVMLAHPRSQEFLQADCQHVADYFAKLGVKGATAEEIIRKIKA